MPPPPHRHLLGRGLGDVVPPADRPVTPNGPAPRPRRESPPVRGVRRLGVHRRRPSTAARTAARACSLKTGPGTCGAINPRRWSHPAGRPRLAPPTAPAAHSATLARRGSAVRQLPRRWSRPPGRQRTASPNAHSAAPMDWLSAEPAKRVQPGLRSRPCRPRPPAHLPRCSRCCRSSAPHTDTRRRRKIPPGNRHRIYPDQGLVTPLCAGLPRTIDRYASQGFVGDPHGGETYCRQPCFTRLAYVQTAGFYMAKHNQPDSNCRKSLAQMGSSAAPRMRSSSTRRLRLQPRAPISAFSAATSVRWHSRSVTGGDCRGRTPEPAGGSCPVGAPPGSGWNSSGRLCASR